MWQALSALETAPTPTKNDWRVCSDCVNLMETLISMGEVQDPDGLLMEAVTALAVAGKRAFVDGQTIRLSGTGMQAVRAILEDYSTVIDLLSARTMIRAHRLTEKRIRDIHSGKRRPHDVEVVSV